MIDLGQVGLARAELQGAADAAALAGAAELQCSCSDKGTRARQAARDYGSRNRVLGSPVAVTGADVQLGRWRDDTGAFEVLTGSAEDGANAVRVTCVRSAARGTRLPFLFGSLVGRDGADLTAVATARVKSSRCGLIIGIASVTMSGSSHTDSYDSSKAAYVASAAGMNGHVCSNGDIVMSGSTAIRGDAHPGRGKVVKSSSSVGVLGAIASLAEPMSFPPVDPGDAATVNDNGWIPKSAFGKAPLNAKKEFTLSGGDSVTLPQGTYYFSKLTLSGGSTIVTYGATAIYVTGDVSLSGGSVVNLTQRPKNLQLYPMGAKCVVSGDSDYYGSMVGGSLVLSGSGGIHADDSLDLAFLRSGVRSAAGLES